MKKIMTILFVLFAISIHGLEANGDRLPLLLKPAVLKNLTEGRPNLMYIDNQNRVEVLIRTERPDGLRKLLKKNGGYGVTYAGGYLTARVPLDRIEEIALSPDVVKIVPSRILKPLLDVSRKSIKAELAESGTGLPRPVTGSDVIVGIVDTGIDYTHPDFKNPDGSTRILSIWDQTILGTPPEGYEYGAECDVDSINAGTCKEVDTGDSFSHGTHVAGITAGSHSTFRGIAPQAMYVIVKTIYTEGAVIDGVDYIFRLAQKYNKPAVVNLSLGGDYGPHDGTGELAQSLAGLLGPGQIIVSAAGNSGGMLIHASDNVATEEWFVFDIEQDNTLAGVEIWYDGADTLDFAIAGLKQTNQLCNKTPFLPPGQSGQYTISCGSLNCGTVYLDTTTVSYSGNGDRSVSIVLQSPSQNESLSKCRWALGVEPNNTDPGGGSFDAWIITGNGEFTPVLLPIELGGIYSKTGDDEKTISNPADHPRIIAVGSYTTKTTWHSKNGNDYTCEPDCHLNDISYFSAKGPTRDGRIKPDITAPGEWIASAKSSDVNVPPKLVLSDGEHFILAGTSMASPHVTGAVALMLDMNPTLTPEDVLSELRSGADTDSFTGSVPNNDWGWGKLNVYNVLSNMNAAGLDQRPPVISDLLVDISDSSINISWTTDELADSYVRLTYNDGTTIEHTSMSFTTLHKVNLADIAGGKPFVIEISSTDPRGNKASVSEISGVAPEGGCGCNISRTGQGSLLFELLLVMVLLLWIREVKRIKIRKPS